MKVLKSEIKNECRKKLNFFSPYDPISEIANHIADTINSPIKLGFLTGIGAIVTAVTSLYAIGSAVCSFATLPYGLYSKDFGTSKWYGTLALKALQASVCTAIETVALGVLTLFSIPLDIIKFFTKGCATIFQGYYGQNDDPGLIEVNEETEYQKFDMEI